MVFSSVIFLLVFLPAVLLCYLLLYRVLRNFTVMIWIGNLFLFVVSLLFYSWGGIRHVPLLLSSIFLNYLVGIILDRLYQHQGESNLRRLIFIGGLLFNLGILVYFKYFNFILNDVFLSTVKIVLPPTFQLTEIDQIFLPLGVSFFTFQGISYIFDIYRRKVSATLNFINLGCCFSIFPHLVAGPIIRYANIETELTQRHIYPERFAKGTSRFIVGLAKKVLVADTLGSVADAAFSIPGSELTPLAAWAGLLCYTLQLYYDFSGYSDMAIGIGQMLGFTFPENFNYPYISRSLKEVWQRWHMTLSSWFRDYLYIPLGGSRKGPIRRSFNLLFVFALCGFWHGAHWNFLLWGIFQGIFLALERAFPIFFERMPTFLKHVYALSVFIFGLLIFRTTDIVHAGIYFQSLFGLYDSIQGVSINKVWLELFQSDVYIAFILGVIGSMPVVPWLKRKLAEIKLFVSPVSATFIDGFQAFFLLGLLLICLMPIFGATYNAFIYFRF